MRRVALLTLSLGFSSAFASEEAPPTPPPLPADLPAPPEEAPLAVAAPSAPVADVVVRPLSSAPAAAGEVSRTVPVALPQSDALTFGLAMDAGIPDGAGVSAVVRPLEWLRFHAGATSNYFGTGVRGGVSLVPFYFGVTPALTVEGGHYFNADLSTVVEAAGIPFGSSLLSDVTYDYVNGHLGVEVGSPRRFVFYLRAGLSALQIQLHSFEEGLRSATQDDTIDAQAAKLSVVTPSAKLGFIVYLF